LIANRHAHVYSAGSRTAIIIPPRSQPAPTVRIPPPRSKDESTTQASLGFRICGVKVTRADGSEWCADRHWGKGLGQESVLEALRQFTDTGEMMCVTG